MNRTICTLSVMNNKVYIMVGRYLNDILYIKDSHEIRDEIRNSKRVQSRSEVIESSLAKQAERGVAIYIDESVPKFSENYEYSSLLFSENPIIHEALRGYFDLEATNSIVWAEGANKLSVKSMAQSVIDERGKSSFSIDPEQLDAASSALLLMCYHALNCDVSDLSYLRQLNRLRGQVLSKKPMFSGKGRRR